MKTNLNLRPFKHLCMTIGNIPSSYIDSMSYYETLVWLCKYIENTVIPAINENAEAVEELQGKYLELKAYVDNYFRNLDVQEEINNKLDEMASSGELAHLISLYLETNAIFAFDVIEDLHNSDNLSEGMFTKTYGKDTYNDGKGQFYKIRQLTSSDVIDEYNIVSLVNYPTLIGEKITNYDIDQLYEKTSTNEESIATINNEISGENGINDQIADINVSLDKKLEKIEHLYNEWNTYYVDKYDGDDDNEGSLENPFKTFQAVFDKVINKGITNINLYFKSGEYDIRCAFMQNLAMHIHSYDGNSSLNFDSYNGSVAVYNCHLNLVGTANNKIVIKGCSQFYLDSGYIIANYTEFQNCKFTLNGATGDIRNSILNSVSCNVGILDITSSEVGCVESDNSKLYFYSCRFNPTKYVNYTRNVFMNLSSCTASFTGDTSIDLTTIPSNISSFISASTSLLSFNAGVQKSGGTFSGNNSFSGGVLAITQARYTTIKALTSGSTTISNGCINSNLT